MASKNDKLTLTSVKVHEDLFEDFKLASIKNKFNLQKLTNRAIHLYLTDEDFENLFADLTEFYKQNAEKLKFVNKYGHTVFRHFLIIIKIPTLLRNFSILAKIIYLNLFIF